MVKLMIFFLFAAFAIFYGIVLLSIVSHGKFFGKFTHKILKWHVPNEKMEVHGINVTSTCKYCGKRIMKCHLDWFTY